LRSISYLRHHSQTGVLHYRRVVPSQLRPFIGKGTISRSLGSKTLDHAALTRWIEIDQEADRRLADARQALAGKAGQDQYVLSYDGRKSYTARIMKFCDGKVARKNQYKGKIGLKAAMAGTLYVRAFTCGVPSGRFIADSTPYALRPIFELDRAAHANADTSSH